MGEYAKNLDEYADVLRIDLCVYDNEAISLIFLALSTFLKSLSNLLVIKSYKQTY